MTSPHRLPAHSAKLLTLAAFLLTSCAPSIQPLDIDCSADLTADCPAPPALVDNADVYDMGEYTVNLLGSYNDCRARQAHLSQCLKNASNQR